jgi:cobaltochelatase CobN
MIRIVASADTDILAAAQALARLPEGFPEVRCLNPSDAKEPRAAVDELLVGAAVVLCRLLGGSRGWPEGFSYLRHRCQSAGIALLALGGEAQPDLEFGARSLAPAGALATAEAYLRHGDVENFAQLLRFLADTFLMEGYGFDPPRSLPEHSFYIPRSGDVDAEQALAAALPDRPTVAICFYRSHRLAGNTDFVDALYWALQDAGANALALWSYSLRPGPDQDYRELPALRELAGRVDAVIVTMLAGGSTRRSAGAGERWLEWDQGALAELGVPIIQAICATGERARWEGSAVGLSPLDAATQVAIPELDGRLIGGVISFKERRREGSPVGAPLACYVPDLERTARVAALAVRHARLRRIAPADRRVALLLTSFPSAEGRVGLAVGLDTPASTLALLHALRRDGMRVEVPFGTGQELIDALVDGGADEPSAEHPRAGELPRLSLAAYLRRYERLPAVLRAAIEERFGRPPGDIGVVDDGLLIGALELGNAVLCVAPTRAREGDPVAVYHDQQLPPNHHYLATYWWLADVFDADAIIHVGKHGTLEWLPGKMLALSAACAPDAAIGDLPLIYPFLVNDPGEGIQAKRRAHALIVDHLLPAQQRAESYEELSELEELLDEYARLESIDPDKLPALGARIWAAVRSARLDRDLALERKPERAEELIEHLDAYLCEVKEMQVGAGLHVLGQAPKKESLRSLIAAVMRYGCGPHPPLRAAIGDAFGVAEAALRERPGARLRELEIGEAQLLLERFPGPSARASDLLDRLQEAQIALLGGLERGHFDPGSARATIIDLLGRSTPQLEATVSFICLEVAPRIAGACQEIDAVLAALRGEHVESGPAGSPTRGRLDVLPTGRNFYSVDPRAIPSELAYEVGERMAQELLERHRREHGALPRAVALVLWGTSTMRTGGEEVAQALALLGVRPRYAPAGRRVEGIEVIPTHALARPRVDVVLRISGFFRDAFPHLIELLDEAIHTVGALAEGPEENFLAAHMQADRAALGAGDSPRSASLRIFSSAPGSYGAGLIELVQSSSWRQRGDLAEAFERHGCYAYGADVAGVQARAALRACLRRVEAAAIGKDSEEQDLLSSGEHYQFHGGLVAAAAALRGEAPAAYISDAADPRQVRTRTLAEELRRVVRARVINPRWIGAMVRHGYKGIAELGATVDYLFGYDASTGAGEGWMYEAVARRYVLDADVAAVSAKANPWAAREIVGRLLEAAERKMWPDAPAGLLGELRARYLELEGEVEARYATPATVPGAKGLEQ